VNKSGAACPFTPEAAFTVIGVFKERISTFGQAEIARESIIVPFGLMKSYAGTDSVKVLYAQASTPQSVPMVARETERLLRSRHRMFPGLDGNAKATGLPKDEDRVAHPTSDGEIKQTAELVRNALDAWQSIQSSKTTTVSANARKRG
jgi:hypothetical protein